MLIATAHEHESHMKPKLLECRLEANANSRYVIQIPKFINNNLDFHVLSTFDTLNLI